MVAATRTVICALLALASAACGVVLPPAEDIEAEDPGSKPATTDSANLPAPAASNAEPGASPGSPAAPGTPADDTDPASPRIYRVFVTSQVWGSDELGGLSGADAKCTSLANANAALTGKKWRAWLSSGTSAVARLGATPGPWARVDGIVVATTPAHLADKLLALFSSIAVDEQGSFHSDNVWTGTRSDGGVSSDTCNGWNGTSGRGLYGRIDFLKPHWTEDGDVDCDGGGGYGGGWNQSYSSGTKPRNRLYCFEVD